ncbi:hypothetical protein DL93DRAFT_1601309 [Clavulina sp. PMI_390]|nr:hypothetical protein DL93DRAFT_1601309 [Clavulina sp. PMI_390]
MLATLMEYPSLLIALRQKIESMAYDLARLALFAESSRGSFKRDDINKKVLAAHTRLFNAVFEAAQEILRKTFGMEMYELMTRIERDKAVAPETRKEGEEAKAPKVTTSSKTYMLRSVLPSALIASTLLPDPAIRDASYSQGVEVADETPEEERPDDTLIAWRLMDNVAVVGILHVILALILANGRSIPNPQLRAQLKKLNLKPSVSIIPHPPQAAFQHAQKPLTLDVLLTQLQKAGYLDRARIATGDSGPRGAGKKRPSTAGARGGDDDGEGGNGEEIEWKWGTRAIGEINELGVARLVMEFMGDRFAAREVGEDEGEEPTQGGQGGGGENGKSEARKKHEEAVMKDLVRSAGGPLMKLKVQRAQDEDQDAMQE